ncbi:MAG: hypothetical protein HWE22_19235 [Flavobacteriales bacterium]|nr:hypothetical protein [Flavobacteriales bacterium]
MTYQIQNTILFLSFLILSLLGYSQDGVYDLGTKDWWLILQIDTQNRYSLDVSHQWYDGGFSQWDKGFVTKKNDTIVLVSDTADSKFSLIEMKMIEVYDKTEDFYFEVNYEDFYFETERALYQIVEIENPRYVDNLLVKKEPKEDPYKFKRFVDGKLLGIVQKEIDQDSTISETTFLGTLRIGESKILVLTQHYSVKAYVGRHNHNQIIFLDENGKTKRVCSLSSSDQFPTEIENNKLKLGELFFDDFSEYLPRKICIPDDSGCYE